MSGYRISTGSDPCDTVEGCKMAMPQRGDPPTPRLPSSLKLPPPRFALGRSRRRTRRRTSMILLRACELPPSPSLPPPHLHAPPSTHIAICVQKRTKCPASHGAFTRASPEVPPSDTYCNMCTSAHNVFRLTGYVYPSTP